MFIILAIASFDYCLFVCLFAWFFFFFFPKSNDKKRVLYHMKFEVFFNLNPNV
jgi:hypothetical protein